MGEGAVFWILPRPRAALPMEGIVGAGQGNGEVLGSLGVRASIAVQAH